MDWLPRLRGGIAEGRNSAVSPEKLLAHVLGRAPGHLKRALIASRVMIIQQRFRNKGRANEVR